MIQFLRRAMPAAWVILLPLLASAAKLPEGCLPAPRTRVLVVDVADLLSASEERALNAALLNFVDTTSNVITVITHPDFCGLSPYEFATEAGEAWGVGRADLDNGIVVALKPRNGNLRGEVFIAVGRGLEGAIPDVITKRIVDEMVPHFAQGAWLRGLEVGMSGLMRLAAGEIAYADYLEEGNAGSRAADLAIFLLFLLFMFGLPAFAIFTSVRRRARMDNLSFWAALALVMASSRSHRGSYRHFTHGSGPFGGGSGFGGSGGGGFGGFGGGSFGGGGAGGSF